MLRFMAGFVMLVAAGVVGLASFVVDLVQRCGRQGRQLRARVRASSSLRGLPAGRAPSSTELLALLRPHPGHTLLVDAIQRGARRGVRLLGVLHRSWTWEHDSPLRRDDLPDTETTVHVTGWLGTRDAAGAARMTPFECFFSWSHDRERPPAVVASLHEGADGWCIERPGRDECFIVVDGMFAGARRPQRDGITNSGWGVVDAPPSRVDATTTATTATNGNAATTGAQAVG